MKYRKLGKSPLKLSEISLGCMSVTDEESAVKLIRTAFEIGINFYDTADLYNYGENEKWIGKAIKPFRKEIYLSTKAGNRWSEGQTGWKWDPSPAYLETAIESSLIRLDTDYIDFFMVHGGTDNDPHEEIIELLTRLTQEGKIRAYGISSIRPNVIRKYAATGLNHGYMMQYSLLDRRPEEDCLNIIASSEASVLARGVLAKGALNGKNISFLDYSEKDTGHVFQKLSEQGNPIALGIGFVLNNSNVTTCTIGARNEEQLKEVIKAYNSADCKMPNIDLLPLKKQLYTEHR